ncbi:MAG: hypothetical protein HWN81_19150 [Candidatus Lokiarchaeota archaeon]|nr:hypothetical protein [Candidatus Lokiarchaeota archaeon]
MKTLLKSYNLSDNAIRIYVDGLGKSPYTFSEIQNTIPGLSEKEIKQILNELVEKSLILLVNPKYSESLPHYITVPPFTAILNSITESSKISEDIETKDSKKDLTLERFQEAIYQDIESITGDLIDAISTQDSSVQTTEILTEVEDNVKKFAYVILNEVIGLISPLKMQSAVDARDFNKLINSVRQKISESEEIVTNMFTQFRDIVKEMAPPDKNSQIEAFKIFIRRLGESIEKRVTEIPIGTGSIPSDKTESIKKSLNNILKSYINVNKASMEKFWNINNYEKIKEIISILFDKCTDNLTIIVPNIKTFIPLEKLELDYSEDLSSEKKAITKKTPTKKSEHKGLSITKKQKKEIEEKLDLTAKKVAELKGFEISHDIAEVLSLISEVNPESAAIDSIQGWLNRLLVIRKHLDSNTQYLLLENIEIWKKDYFKVKKKEEPEKELLDELKEKISEEKPFSIGLHLHLISSESHDNKHAMAFANKANTEYLQLKNNNVIAILGDNSYLIFGVYHQTSFKPTFEISGFFTTYSPMLDIFKPLIEDIKNKAKHTKEIEINRGFNEIIENINDYPGRKISKRLKRLIDVAFEKDGISLDILELKLLVGKLEKSYLPLDDEMKEYIINELNKLNKKFSTLELIYPPEFRPSILEEETEGELEVEITSSEIESLDPDKVDNLFELLIDKIDELKGVEIGEQIDKFIEVILKLQGYSEIIEWKQSLSTVNEPLEEPFKEKIKNDLLSWKKGILQQSLSSGVSTKEESVETYEQSQRIISKQETTASIFEEEYTSPGLAQSQFEDEENSSTTGDSDKIDTKLEMKEFFNKIQGNLGELSGTEISKLLQNIVDIILETEGYSMALKGIKDWISKLRMIRTPLETEIKEDFELEFLKMKQKYSTDDDETSLDFSPSFERIEESVEEGGSGNGETLIDKFNHLIQNAPNLNGNELSENLQDIADIVLQSHGAVAVNVIRQWISKLRSIKEPLEDEIKEEFLTELENWKEKLA